MASNMKIGEQHCEIDPSPLYTSSTYTLIAPSQSTLPPDYIPGWDTMYPASQIAWEPNPDAPTCLQDQGIKTMKDWIDWIHENIISIICDWKKTPCMWMIGGVLRPIGETLSDCLKMTKTNYTIVYDSTNKIAISGEIFDSSTCTSFIADQMRCVLNAIILDAAPIYVLGTNANDSDLKPYWYSITLPQTTKLIHRLVGNAPNNARSSVPSGERLVPLAELPVLTTTAEGNIYNSATGVWTIVKSGFYRFNYSSFVNIGYTPMGTGNGHNATMNVLGGVLVETNNGLGRNEVRLFQQPFWREYGTDNQQNVKFSYANFFNANTKITPRIWLATVLGTINTVQFNTVDGSGNMYLSRVPDATFD